MSTSMKEHDCNGESLRQCISFSFALCPKFFLGIYCISTPAISTYSVHSGVDTAFSHADVTRSVAKLMKNVDTEQLFAAIVRLHSEKASK